MKICIDISQVVYGTGVSVYTKNLVENLLRIDKVNEYILFAGSLRKKKDILSIFPDARVFPIPPTVADFVWNRLHLLPIEKLVGNIDVFHSSDWAEPPSNFAKVTTVHDLYPIKFPKMIYPLIREVHRRKLGWVVKESKQIIVPSVTTKSDLVRLGVSDERIRVIPEAPTMTRQTEETVRTVKSKYRLTGEYLIAIGVTKLKNTERIIRAFHLAKAGRDVKLVLVGNPVGVNVKEERNVRILGFVPQEDLAALVSGSSGLVFASLYEGFGLPILDAYSCQVPVVTSNLGSMKEVAGDAAALVDPYSEHSISEGIIKILRGPKGYIEKGAGRVVQFSWKKTAEETLRVYQEAFK